MARYTLNLSEICQVLTNTDTSNMQGNAFDYIDDITSQALPIIFSNRISIYDNDVERELLLRKILEHYWEYEICTYTPNDFILRINRKLNEIMPYYNQLWESTKLEFDPFVDTDYTSEGKTDANDTTSEDNNQDQKHSGNDTDTADHTGADTRNSQDGGSESAVSTNTQNNTGTSHNEREDNYTATRGDITPKHWRYNNDTPQNSVSGITEQDYLSSYSMEKDDLREVKHLNGALGQDVDYVDANGGQLNEYQNKVTDDGNTTNESTAKGTNEVEFGKSNLIVDSYDSQIKTKHEYDSNVNTKTDNLKNFIHDGKTFVHYKGKMNSGRSYSEMLNLYRQTMLNIDQQIIDNLRELFFIIK